MVVNCYMDFRWIKNLEWKDLTQLAGSTWVQIIYAVSHVTFYCFFLRPMSFFISILLRRVTFNFMIFLYMCLYYNYIL